MSQLPLTAGFRPDATFAVARGKPVSAREFEAAVRALAARLPSRRHVVNLCEDRYAFMVAFGAALTAGQTTLLPPSRAPQAVEDAKEGRDAYTLRDDEVLHAGVPGGELLIDENHIAAIVFTSGSTGKPAPHEKTWGSLVAGARALGSRLAAGGGGVVGTIPPQHMFGLESTVMLPLQNGLAVHAARPLLPGDLAEAAAALPSPRWLMTSPLHLRACVAAAQPLPALAGVLSSTMPLDPQLARDAEALWGAPVLEIYGSSEAGMVAMRRGAQDPTWELCPGVELDERDGETWVGGGHIREPQRIADELERKDARRFTLHGRKASLVKIAGKRSSLEALNAALLRIEGVLDGAFYLRDGAERLGALVVAPGRDENAIRAELRRHIDPAFLPRPLYLVPKLPRNETGKLTRQALLAMVGSVPASHPALPGHFPGAPVVPGVVVLEKVLRAAGVAGAARFPSVKFHAPLSPGEEFVIRVDHPKFTVHRGRELIVSGKLG